MPTKDFKLPDLGEGVHEGQVLHIHVAEGQSVREDQPLMEVETDKAAVVIPCPHTGVVTKVHVTPGQLVHVGDVMVTFSDSAPPLAAKHAAKENNATTPAAPAPRSSGSGGAPSQSRHASTTTATLLRKPASPAVRKLARSRGLDIESITGSGPGGRVQIADVERAASAHSPQHAAHITAPPPQQTFAQPKPSRPAPAAPSIVAARVQRSAMPESFVVDPPAGSDSADQHGPTRLVPLSQARKTIARVMGESWSTIPHVTDCDDADVTELDRLRQGYNAPEHPDRKLTMLAFVIRAVARALQRFPDFNAHFDAEANQVVYKRYINIAVGVHTERGLIAPVIRNADQLNIPEISDTLAELAEKARTASFAVNDTRGGTYTISNAGAMGGSRYSTPLITPGQSAVLALGRSRWLPWVVEGRIIPRLIMPLSHSIDHRLLDGGQEIPFLQHIIADLQNPARLLL